MKNRIRNLDKIISSLITIQDNIEKLPPLSSVEKAKLEQSIAIDQLYYSSKLEGTTLSERMIADVIHNEQPK